MPDQSAVRKGARPSGLVQFAEACCEKCNWKPDGSIPSAVTYAARKHAMMTGHKTEVSVINRRIYSRPSDGTVS